MFSEKLKNLMSINRTKVPELASHLGVSPKTVYAYLSSGRMPSVEKLAGIADYFGVTVDYLLDRVKTPTWNMREDEWELLQKYKVLTQKKKEIFTRLLDLI